MNTFKSISLVFSLVFVNYMCYAQTPAESEETKEIYKITEVLNHYIEGTANGEPDRLRLAFHPYFNLYTVTEDQKLRIRSGEQYISGYKEGKKTNRIGRIISIDYENFAAIAKVEVVMPNKRIYKDYFLLLKYEGAWKIVHKSYTSIDLP